MPGALSDIRVLDAGMMVQGPQAAALFSDMGADVIKIEVPVFGDQVRYVYLSPDDRRSAFFSACNRGKRGLTLDLRTPAGAGIFRRLATAADVVISNFAPGILEGWGLGYETLAELNPGIVWAAASTFGPRGPDADRRGADLAGQAAGGLISTIGYDGEPPSPVGATIADHIGSLNLAAGILAALHARERRGRGQRIDVSLVGGQIWAQASEYTHCLMTGEQPGRSNHGHPLFAPIYGVFETADGWIALLNAAPAANDAFLIALGHPELALDDRTDPENEDPAAHDWFAGILREAFRKRTSADWREAFSGLDIRYALVRNYRDVIADPGAWENGYFAEIPDSQGVLHRVVGTPIHMSDTPMAPGATAPELGEHTGEILREAGYTDEEIEGFRRDGVV